MYAVQAALVQEVLGRRPWPSTHSLSTAWACDETWNTETVMRVLTECSCRCTAGLSSADCWTEEARRTSWPTIRISVDIQMNFEHQRNTRKQYSGFTLSKKHSKKRKTFSKAVEPCAYYCWCYLYLYRMLHWSLQGVGQYNFWQPFSKYHWYWDWTTKSPQNAI